MMNINLHLVSWTTRQQHQQVYGRDTRPVIVGRHCPVVCLGPEKIANSAFHPSGVGK